MSKIYAEASVFQDEQRHTCIKLFADKDGVTYIPMSTELKVEKVSHRQFEQNYCMELADYPVKRAAESYLGATWLVKTPEALSHLEKLAEISTNRNKESTMTAAKEAASKKAPAKKTAAPKADGKKAASAKKVAAPATKGKAAKAEGGSVDTRKITLLQKENPKREGSASFDRYELYRSCKTVADFVAAGGKAADIAWDAKHGYISVA